MADSDSEIEFSRQPQSPAMEGDRPDSDIEDQDHEVENARPNRAASVLSSVEGMPDLEDFAAQQPRSKRALEGEYLGIPIDTNARGDTSTNARAHATLHTSPPMKPQTFNGDEDWESYLSHFEVCAELGRWSHQDKALYLAACLRGNAQVYYMTLKMPERTSYHTLTTKLGQRFGNTRQQPMWISRLEARMRKPNESVAELGDDLRRLAQRAYSNMNHEAREMLALNQLYKSVSPDLKYKCISENCTSVTKAVSIIEIYEGILGEDLSKKKLIRQATAEDSSQQSNGSSGNHNPGNEDLQNTLRQLQSCIERLTRQCNNQTRDRNGQRLCYNCLSPNHLQRQCPQNPRNRRDQRPIQRQPQYARAQAYNEGQSENHRPSTQ